MNVYRLTNGDHVVVVAANDEQEARNRVSLEIEGSQEISFVGQSTHSSPWQSCQIEGIETGSSDYTTFTIIKNSHDAENQ